MEVKRKEDLGGLPTIKELVKGHFDEFIKEGDSFKSFFDNVLMDISYHLLNEISLEVLNISKCGCHFGHDGEILDGCGCAVRSWNQAVDTLEKIKNKLRDDYGIKDATLTEEELKKFLAKIRETNAS